MSITNVGPRPTMPVRTPSPVPMANTVLPAVNTPVAAPEAQPAATRASTRDAFVAPRTSTPTRLETFISRGNVLRFGASGPEVLDLQKFLGMKTVEQDSDFGPRTAQALKSFQRAHGMDASGVVDAATLAQLKRAGQSGNDGALLKTAVEGGKIFGVGDSGAEVRALQRLVGMPAAAQDGVYGLATREAVGAFQRARLGMNSQSPGYGQFGPTTHKAATSASTTPAPTTPAPTTPVGQAQVDSNNPTLRKLATGRLVGAAPGLCVTATLDNMQRLGIPQPAATGNDVGNNPRGGMVQLMKDFGWKSVPLPGATQQAIKSPYGTVNANVIPAAEYRKLAEQGKIPSGAIVFQTRHASWNSTSGGSRGFDMGIARDGGRTLFNFADMGGPMVYGASTSSVVVLVPGDALR